MFLYSMKKQLLKYVFLDLTIKDFYSSSVLAINQKCGFLDIAHKLLVCPECGKQNLFLHRKTYEQTIIFCCNSCRLTSSFEPLKDAYYDENEAWRVHSKL